MAVVCTLYLAKPPILFYPFSPFVILFCPNIDPDPDPHPHPDPHQLHTFIPKNQKRYGTTFQCAVCSVPRERFRQYLHQAEGN